ncbi:MAG TPA: DUF4286 family protein [Anaerolineae bacterium]|nr:DUF4286 family protein [Anaerolineae bacterium]
MSEPVFYVVTAEVNPAVEAEWCGWWVRTHAPDVLAQPGFMRVTLYRADTQPGEWSRYVAIYEVESHAALEAYFAGDAVNRLRADFQSRYGSVTRVSRQVLSPVQIVE